MGHLSVALLQQSLITSISSARGGSSRPPHHPHCTADRKTVFHNTPLHDSGLTILFLSSLIHCAKAAGSTDTDAPFRAGNSTDTYSQHFLSLYKKTRLHCEKETPLTKLGSNSHILVSLTTWLISKTRVAGSLLGSIGS